MTVLAKLSDECVCSFLDGLIMGSGKRTPGKCAGVLAGLLLSQ